MSKKVTLREWAASRYARVPHDNTLRTWAKNCWIFPVPEKHGRSYMVDEDARFIGKDHSKLYGSEAA
jgi:hypothetical protein